MQKEFDFMHNADNVYRTENYIISQRVHICRNGAKEVQVMSEDTYYLRTLKRDYEYESVFKAERANLDGKRFPTTMHIKRYVE